jgi:predicted ribosomally synthesized peptide with nif11-like leader
MSRQNAEAFLDRMRTDHAFQRNILDCNSPESRQTYAQSEGYELSKADFKASDRVEAEMTIKSCCIGPNED